MFASQCNASLNMKLTMKVYEEVVELWLIKVPTLKARFHISNVYFALEN